MQYKPQITMYIHSIIDVYRLLFDIKISFTPKADFNSDIIFGSALQRTLLNIHMINHRTERLHMVHNRND
jgi:hypothetical protein